MDDDGAHDIGSGEEAALLRLRLLELEQDGSASLSYRDLADLDRLAGEKSPLHHSVLHQASPEYDVDGYRELLVRNTTTLPVHAEDIHASGKCV